MIIKIINDQTQLTPSDTKEKPFGCTICEQTFARRDLLVRHEKRNHNNADQSPCTQSDGNHGQSNSIDIFQNLPDNVASIDSALAAPGSHAEEQLPGCNDPVPNLTWQSNAALFPVQAEAGHQFQHEFFSDFLMDSSMQDLWNDPTFLQFTDLNAQNDAATALESPHKSSLLSRPVSPSIPAETDQSEISGPLAPRVFVVSDALRQRFLHSITAKQPHKTLPSSSSLSLFINQYFKTFHKHQPMLHESTLDLDNIPMSLVLAISANGAQYSLEATVARNLFLLSRDFLSSDDDSIHILQTQMLLLAFSAWSGRLDDLETALQLQAAMTLRLRRERRLLRNNQDTVWTSWSDWINYEALKRSVVPFHSTAQG